MRAIHEADERPTGFQLGAGGGLFLLRDYSDDDVDDLKVLRGLVQQILTDHKFLIPGSMNRYMIQWHADLHRAIEAKGKKDENEHPGESPAS